MVNSIALIGFSGFIGKSITEYFHQNSNFKIHNCRSLKDLSEISRNYLLIFAAGKFFGSDNELLDVNVNYLRLVLNQFINTKGTGLIYFSSGAVYNNVYGNKSNENDLTAPRTFYGFTKDIAEKNIISYAKKIKFSYFILRLPNVYGKKQKKGVVFNIYKNIKNNKPIVIHGKGNDVRDYLHINDLLCAIELILINQPKSGIYNISSNETLSVLELANKLSKSKNYPKVFIESNNKLKTLSLDFSKAYKAFGYKPKINAINLSQ